LGAVMGNILLKAIIVKGTKKIEFHDEENLQKLRKIFSKTMALPQKSDETPSELV
jgi:aldehyde:ferredoxin oxidoreductase